MDDGTKIYMGFLRNGEFIEPSHVATAVDADMGAHIAAALYHMASVSERKVSMLDAEAVSRLANYMNDNLEGLLGNDDRHVRALMLLLLNVFSSSESYTRDNLFRDDDKGHLLRCVRSTVATDEEDVIASARRQAADALRASRDEEE